MAARDRTEPLMLLNNQRFGLIITDLVMPKLSGFQLVDLLPGLIVGSAYYFGAVIGFALTFPGNLVSVLWPPAS